MSDFLGAYGIVHGILQGIIVEWVAVPFPEDRPTPGIKDRFPTVQVASLPAEPPGNFNTA